MHVRENTSEQHSTCGSLPFLHSCTDDRGPPCGWKDRDTDMKMGIFVLLNRKHPHNKHYTLKET